MRERQAAPAMPAVRPVQRLDQMLAGLRARLKAAGFDEPEREARALLVAATGISAAQIIAEPGTVLSMDHQSALERFMVRRLDHEPLSRIVGAREFYGRSFKVTPDTLDPRPETETVVDAALAIADQRGWRERPIRILDVGTGSGCLLVTLLAELPLAVGLGTDILPAALDVARENAAMNGVGDRVSFAQARSLEGVDGPFDLVVSNPPYIPSADIGQLDRAVRDYDPRAALDGGADGLDIYREIAAGLGRILCDGAAVLEVGAGQAEAVAGLLSRAAGDGRVRFWSDLGGHVRTVALEQHSLQPE